MSLPGLLLPALIVCAAGGGFLLVNWALPPVDRMSQSAEQKSMQNPESRFPVVPTGDALERLSVSLNRMLGRLGDSVQSSQRFIADASHELRTPLTVVKGKLPEIVGSDAMRREVRERVGSVPGEVALLEHLISGLLALSRLDAGEAQREWVDVDMAQFADSTTEPMRLMAKDRGIPPSALQHVFDRFYRVDEARSRDDGGVGLGHSIVKSICSAHGAEIELESGVEIGSCFRLKLSRTSLGAAPLVSSGPRETAALASRMERSGGASSPAPSPGHDAAADAQLGCC